MKNLLTKVKKENFKDLKKSGEYNKKSYQDIEGVCTFIDIEDFELEETNLYKYLKSLSNCKLDQIIKHVLIGREMSRYYGTTLKIDLKEYLEYFQTSPVIMSKDKDVKIEYICSKSRKLNNYIDTILRYEKRLKKYLKK